jgi:hypothetical protein
LQKDQRNDKDAPDLTSAPNLKRGARTRKDQGNPEIRSNLSPDVPYQQRIHKHQPST